MKEFEYHVLDLFRYTTAPVIQKALNELGKEGWELVSYDDKNGRAIFKKTTKE